MPSDLKVILFDFDGVIVDTFAFCHRISNMRSPVAEEDYRARFEGNINEALKNVNRGLTPHFDFFGHYTPELLLCRPNAELAKAIKTLARDHVLVIISSTTTGPITEFLTLHGLRDCFKEILGNDVEKSKVKKIQGVLNRYGIEPSETVFITDTLGDIREAETCGVKSIAVSWGYHPIETLERGKPHRIVTHPEELAETIESLEEKNR
jgi:phosphoglycolate phosphatase